jgi:guanidinopropionase
MNDASNPSRPTFPQPVSGTVVPRFGDIATFMRLPLFRNPADVEIGMVGVPWDGGTTNRPGARHGPRQMRDLSTMMRRVHHVTGVAPYELARCGDLGDAPVNPASLDDSLDRIEKHIGTKLERRRYKDFDHGVGRFGAPAKDASNRLRQGHRKSSKRRYV